VVAHVKRGHLHLWVFLAAIKHQEVVHAAKVERIVESAMFVLEIVIPPRVDTFVCSQIGEHHWTLLQEHKEAVKAHEHSVKHKRDRNDKISRGLVFFFHKERHMEGQVEAHLHGDPKQKYGKKFMIFFSDTVVDPGTVVVEATHTLVAEFAVLGAKRLHNSTAHTYVIKLSFFQTSLIHLVCVHL